MALYRVAHKERIGRLCESDIWRGSVATRLRRGEMIFYYESITNLLLVSHSERLPTDSQQPVKLQTTTDSEAVPVTQWLNTPCCYQWLRGADQWPATRSLSITVYLTNDHWVTAQTRPAVLRSSSRVRSMSSMSSTICCMSSVGCCCWADLTSAVILDNDNSNSTTDWFCVQCTPRIKFTTVHRCLTNCTLLTYLLTYLVTNPLIAYRRRHRAANQWPSYARKSSPHFSPPRLHGELGWLTISK